MWYPDYFALDHTILYITRLTSKWFIMVMVTLFSNFCIDEVKLSVVIKWDYHYEILWIYDIWCTQSITDLFFGNCSPEETPNNTLEKKFLPERSIIENYFTCVGNFTLMVYPKLSIISLPVFYLHVYTISWFYICIITCTWLYHITLSVEIDIHIHITSMYCQY